MWRTDGQNDHEGWGLELLCATKKLKLSEGIHNHNTHELRTKVEKFTQQPEDDDKGWIPFYKIDDESEVTRFVVIFSTNNLLRRLHQSKQLHVDATYRLYPVFLCFNPLYILPDFRWSIFSSNFFALWFRSSLSLSSFNIVCCFDVACSVIFSQFLYNLPD